MTKIKLSQYVIALGAITVLSACSSTSTQISSYGAAVEQLTSQIDATINETNQLSIDYKLSRIAEQSHYGANKDSSNGGCFIVVSQITDNVDGNSNLCTRIGLPTFEDITPVIPENEIKSLYLYKANKALQSYAQSLQKLNDAGSAQEITSATIKLDSSLVGLYTQYEALSGDTTYNEDFHKTLDIVSGSIAAIGRSVAEAKRRKALKTIIKEADPWIIRVTKSMEQELNNDHFGKLKKAYEQTSLRELFTNYNDLVRANKLDKQQRKQMINDIYETWKDYSAREMKSNALVKAVEKIRVSHNTLKSEVSKDIFASSEISNTVSELNDYYKQLDSFHELLASCKGILKLEDETYTCSNEG